MELNERIRAAREHLSAVKGRKVTQVEMAKLCGWEDSQSRVGNYEAGSRKPAVEDLIRIAKAAGVSENWLVFGKGSMVAGKDLPLEGLGVTSWESEDDLGSEEVLIPVFKVQLEAGNGSLIPEFVETGEPRAFSRSWLTKKGLHETTLRLLSVRGDSMLPTLADGDLVLIDTSQTDIIEGRIYALAIGREAKIKRLKVNYDGAIVVMSDNPMPEYADEVVPPHDLEHVHIIGLAVHRSGDL